MGLRNFVRSLTPGNDHQLADDIAAQKRIRRSHAATQADRQGQQWDAKDRKRDRRGGWVDTDWDQ